MPLVALLLDDCNVAYDYKEKISNGFIKFESYIIMQEDGKLLFVVFFPVFYICELAIFNPLFRWITKKGLKKAGYKDTGLNMLSVNRFELVKRLIK